MITEKKIAKRKIHDIDGRKKFGDEPHNPHTCEQYKMSSCVLGYLKGILIETRFTTIAWRYQIFQPVTFYRFQFILFERISQCVYWNV